MIICIGGVCIPLWGLIPFALMWFKNVWQWIYLKFFARKPAQQPSSDSTETKAASKETDEGTSQDSTNGGDGVGDAEQIEDVTDPVVLTKEEPIKNLSDDVDVEHSSELKQRK
eukprot:m.44076 g.44076  ORF g.44076 m.44076 type:complete len:113 (-) comp10816_c1_seq1:354-692(-)